MYYKTKWDKKMSKWIVESNFVNSTNQSFKFSFSKGGLGAQLYCNKGHTKPIVVDSSLVFCTVFKYFIHFHFFMWLF
jgi:hypothetical protein